jgi:hypothetical protein
VLRVANRLSVGGRILPAWVRSPRHRRHSAPPLLDATSGANVLTAPHFRANMRPTARRVVVDDTNTRGQVLSRTLSPQLCPRRPLYACPAIGRRQGIDAAARRRSRMGRG